jgi:hypothetical protein
MPYFQRTRSSGSPEAASPDAARAATGIVERAVSILDQQLASNPVVPTATTFGPGFVPPGLPASALGVGDAYGRVHELLRELLNLLGASEASPAARATTAAPLPSTAPVLQSRPVKAGETLTVAVPLANAAPTPAHLIFYSTGFVGDGGFEIPSLQVTFSPRTMTLGAHARGHTDMNIAVPARSPAGLYSAVVQATGLSAPQAIVVVKVE